MGGFLPPGGAGLAGGVCGVAHVAAFDEDRGDFGQVESAEVVADVEAAVAEVGAVRLPGAGVEGASDRVAEPLLENLEEWILGDIQDASFAQDDPKFIQANEDFQPNGFHSRVYVPRIIGQTAHVRRQQKWSRPLRRDRARIVSYRV